MALINLDLSDVKTQDDFSPVPPGEYELKVVHAAVEPTKSKDYLKVTVEFEAVNPAEYRGRKVWDQLNIQALTQGANPEAVRIGREKLKTLATAGGHRNPTFVRDSDELLGFVVSARLEVDGEWNKVKGYKAVASRQMPQEATPTEAAPQKSTKAKRPWEK